MKFNTFSQTILRAVFGIVLFTSQQVLAAPKAFILSTTDNSVVGQGAFEENSDRSAQIEVTLQGLNYFGAGNVKNTNPSARQLQRGGMRADRAFFKSMTMRHKKHIDVTLVALDGSKLSCEINISGAKVGGQCTNPNDEEVLSIRTSIGDNS